MSHDAQTRFHHEWLGLAQPIEGLVFSIPVLADAQIAPLVGTELGARFRAWLVDHDAAPALPDLRRFFAEFLGYARPGMLVERDALPPELSFYAEEGRQHIRPSFAIARGPFEPDTDDPFAAFAPAPASTHAPTPASPSDASPYLALVWDLRDDAGPLGLDLDKPETETGPWRHPPTAKLERLLRATGIPIGLLCNGRALRLVHAPASESTSHLTFRFADLAEPAGRPLLAAFELILHARRTYEAAPEHTLEGLLRESRRRQADVTKDLAAQVFEAVEILLEGFETAAAREGEHVAWLDAALDAPHDHFYQGVLSVVLRLVFLLYAEDQGLLPIAHPTYAKHMSVQGLHAELVDDAGMHPESMHHRFGAYGRLLALFRGVFVGVRHRDLVLPPRRGRLFDPSSYPFLEGGLPGSAAPIVHPEARAELRPPQIDDGVVHAVLERLVIFQGQRLSYRALDVEQIGSVYESLMGYHVQRTASTALRLGKQRVWVELAALRAQKSADRKKWLKEHVGLTPAQQDALDQALADHPKADDALADALLANKKAAARTRDRVAPGRLILQPGEERRRSGSHYTPRSLTERIVRRTLEPILACLGPEPSEAQLLSLEICDPAMGSGAFLVETCRHLADQLVAAWTRSGALAAILEQHGDAHLHARRLVAQRCLYGVDKNPAAVELAKLSLWLITMSRELPFTFVDHALRHGDSLVGLDLEQVSSFHWQAGKQIPLFREVLRDALEQALEYRREIHALARYEDPDHQGEKRRLLDHAEHATAKIRLIADACVGAFFAETKDKAREAERVRRMGIIERWLSGEEDELEAQVKGMAEEIRERHAPFHWWLEFPEVFYLERPDPLDGGKVNGAACMEAFVGNPPFMGGVQVSGSLGEPYLDWLKEISPGAHGNADISAHFFRRAARLLGAHGTIGLISTNTIGQGDTRSTGLKHLVTASNFMIYDATPNLAWPGTGAAVIVSIVLLAKGAPTSVVEDVVLHDTPSDDKTATVARRVSAISSQLRPAYERQEPSRLLSNAELSYQGSIVLGMGFVITPEERDVLIRKNGRNAQRIFPYLGGAEVNVNLEPMFERYVIDFGQMAFEDASKWPDLLEIIRDKVKPERDRQKREPLRRLWWQYAEKRPGLYSSLKSLRRCLLTTRVKKHNIFLFSRTDMVFANTLYVFPIEVYSAFSALQSRVHEAWIKIFSSTMKSDINYAPSDCFDNFPFPAPDPRSVIPELESAGQAFYEARARFMLDTQQGLTKTYNAMKDPACTTPAVLELRRLTAAMDQAVLAAYGWTDLVVPPYCPTTPAEQAAHTLFEDTIIDRLYQLNADRAAAEARLGLGKKAKKSARTKKPTPDDGGGQGALF